MPNNRILHYGLEQGVFFTGGLAQFSNGMDLDSVTTIYLGLSRADENFNRA